ncbi:hypothetical protein MANES_09G048901v8 [Manihot esculenta]|uniref:Uncharacterized protein n=1 Tax=Manihot esculenta TaxID=3983 RepID=A0ACB7H3E2_MANES|nr:hypothetical protein MANES_09G048901v8 [Manihot esculenta]
MISPLSNVISCHPKTTLQVMSSLYLEMSCRVLSSQSFPSFADVKKLLFNPDGSRFNHIALAIVQSRSACITFSMASEQTPQIVVALERLLARFLVTEQAFIHNQP